MLSITSCVIPTARVLGYTLLNYIHRAALYSPPERIRLRVQSNPILIQFHLQFGRIEHVHGC